MQSRIKWVLLLTDKIFIISAPLSIRIYIDAKSTWKKQNLSGSYHFAEFHNERAVYKVYLYFIRQIGSKYQIESFYFKRDKLTESGEEVFIFYQMFNKRWKFAKESTLRDKRSTSWIYLESSGKRKI